MVGADKLPQDDFPERHDTLAARSLRIAVLRIGFVALCAGAVSYYINHASLEEAVRKQLVLSTEQTLQRESLPFVQIKALQNNFLDEFQSSLTIPGSRQKLARDFDRIFYRHADGSYTQRPGLFEGRPLADGRSYAGMSATYAPEISPNEDIKARFVLSYYLSHKFGSSLKGRLFNFYGVIPEKGFPIYQSADIARVFVYSGPDALKLDTFEFFKRGFAAPARETVFTRMYWDASNTAWMTTIATPDEISGRHRILACVDVLLDELMQRMGKPAIRGARSAVFMGDAEGTLIYHANYAEEIKKTEGHASIKSLGLVDEYPLLEAMPKLRSGNVALVDTKANIVALGLIPETPWVLAVYYPKSLMQPSIRMNLAVVILLGLITLFVEVFILRSILQKQVALPLSRLVRAARLLGSSGEHRMNDADLPVHLNDEIGELARDFSLMSRRVKEARLQLELKVSARTLKLKQANEKLEQANLMLQGLSMTDELTGIANRRYFNEALDMQWKHAQRTGDCLMLAMIDVDWFKKYNDCYGHPAGDECLRHVAGMIQAQANRAGDLVARYGGEEFVFVGMTGNEENALYFAETICAAVAQAAIPHAASPFDIVTVSIGVATVLPEVGKTRMDLLKKADAALYLAKEQGRNRAVWSRGMSAVV